MRDMHARTPLGTFDFTSAGAENRYPLIRAMLVLVVASLVAENRYPLIRAML